jgi:TRAP-type C4-dicarboxylate transport system substrate-binding protein
MKGWQRLWVLVSGIYLVLVIVFAAMSFPKPESILHSQALYDQLAPEIKKKILGTENSEKYRSEKGDYLEEARKRDLITEVEMPNGHIIIFLSEVPKQEMQAVAKQYWSVVEKSATRQRVRHIALAFVWWVLPALALYSFGWSVGWVYRGFKK